MQFNFIYVNMLKIPARDVAFHPQYCRFHPPCYQKSLGTFVKQII